MQPVAEDGPRSERGGLADQDEERGLEGVLGVGVVAQDAAADAQDHRAVPAHQRGEGRLVAPAEELLQELAVRLTHRSVGANPSCLCAPATATVWLLAIAPPECGLQFRPYI